MDRTMNLSGWLLRTTAWLERTVLAIELTGPINDRAVLGDARSGLGELPALMSELFAIRTDIAVGDFI